MRLRRHVDEWLIFESGTEIGWKAKSVSSQINRDKVAALLAAGRMTPHGLAHVTAAQADGRWDTAYAPMRDASADTLPKDLMAAILANPNALETFHRLGEANLFALGLRVNNMETPAGRARKIQTLVAMLAGGEKPSCRTNSSAPRS